MSLVWTRINNLLNGRFKWRAVPARQSNSDNLKVWQVLLIPILMFFAVSTACHFIYSHPSDNQLIERLTSHRAEFEKLVSMSKSDKVIKTLTDDTLIMTTGTAWRDGKAGAERIGFDGNRWNEYQGLFKTLGIKCGMFNSYSGVEFQMDCPSMFNGDSVKGIAYLETPPFRLVDNLDRHKPLQAELGLTGGYVVYRKIAEHWYLFLLIG
jgi:hypothetical protein